LSILVFVVIFAYFEALMLKLATLHWRVS